MSLFSAILFWRDKTPPPAPEAAPEPEAPPPPAPRAVPASELPAQPHPLVAAMLGKPNELGAVQVLPPGLREHAPSFTVAAEVLTPGEIEAYCRATPIHRNRIAPPADAPFLDKAAFTAVYLAIPELERAKLYARGGIPLINETVMAAVEKLKAAEAAK